LVFSLLRDLVVVHFPLNHINPWLDASPVYTIEVILARFFNCKHSLDISDRLTDIIRNHSCQFPLVSSVILQAINDVSRYQSIQKRL
jgi:hypothetical protein